MLPAHSGESNYRYWMPGTFLKSEYHFEPYKEPDMELEEPAVALKERVFKESTLWPEGGAVWQWERPRLWISSLKA